jgi:hypothetical protein
MTHEFTTSTNPIVQQVLTRTLSLKFNQSDINAHTHTHVSMLSGNGCSSSEQKGGETLDILRK